MAANSTLTRSANVPIAANKAWGMLTKETFVPHPQYTIQANCSNLKDINNLGKYEVQQQSKRRVLEASLIKDDSNPYYAVPRKNGLK